MSCGDRGEMFRYGVCLMVGAEAVPIHLTLRRLAPADLFFYIYSLRL